MMFYLITFTSSFLLLLPKPDLVMIDKFLARSWFIHCPDKKKTLGRPLFDEIQEKIDFLILA